MHALFCTFVSGFGSVKIIKIGLDLTELQSNVHCYVLWIKAKM